MDATTMGHLDANDQDEITPSPPLSLLRETVFVAIVCNAQLLTQAGLGQSIAPLHIIGKAFGLDETSSRLSWFPAAYSLTVGTFILFAGRLGDIFGYKRLFIAGWTWYALWSLLAGFSVYSNEIYYDICRALQGIGPAVLLPNAIAILGRAYPPGPRKDMVFSLFGATAPGGFVLGAFFSSIFAQLSTWAWAYWTLGIICAILAALSFVVIPSDECTDRPIEMYMFDVCGTLTGVAGMILVNIAWNQAAVVGWPKPYTYIMLIIGLAFIATFAVIEPRAKRPLLDVKQFSSSTLYVLGCIGAGWASFGIWVFYLWQLMEVLRHASPLLATAYFCPIAISGCCAAITTGFLMSRLTPAWIMLIAMSAFLTGNILIATAPVDQTYWTQTFIAILIMPWGMVSSRLFHGSNNSTC